MAESLVMFGMVVVIAFFVWAICSRAALLSRQQRKAKLEGLMKEAEAFLRRVEAHGGEITPARTSILVGKGEAAVMDEPSTLYETRTLRVSGGGGTRVGRFLVGGAVSQYRQAFQQIDQGRLTLTTTRLVFTGGRETRSIPLRSVVGIQPNLDSFVVNASGRQKASIFTVRNPFIWCMLFEPLAKGVLQAVPKTSTTLDVPPTATPKPLAQDGSQHPVREVSHEEAQRFFRRPNNPD